MADLLLPQSGRRVLGFAATWLALSSVGSLACSSSDDDGDTKPSSGDGDTKPSSGEGDSQSIGGTKGFIAGTGGSSTVVDNFFPGGAFGDDDVSDGDWPQCFRGQYVVGNSASEEDIDCAPCPEGSFSTTANAESCTEWTDCDQIPADETKAPTSTSDRECSAPYGECFCTSGAIIPTTNPNNCPALCARATRVDGMGGMGGGTR